MSDETCIAKFCSHACKELALMLQFGKDACALLLSIHKALKRHTALDSSHYETLCGAVKAVEECRNIRGFADDGQELLRERPLDAEL